MTPPAPEPLQFVYYTPDSAINSFRLPAALPQQRGQLEQDNNAGFRFLEPETPESYSAKSAVGLAQSLVGNAPKRKGGRRDGIPFGSGVPIKTPSFEETPVFSFPATNDDSSGFPTNEPDLHFIEPAASLPQKYDAPRFDDWPSLPLGGSAEASSYHPGSSPTTITNEIEFSLRDYLNFDFEDSPTTEADEYSETPPGDEAYTLRGIWGLPDNRGPTIHRQQSEC
jgi:hypothetical protein